MQVAIDVLVESEGVLVVVKVIVVGAHVLVEYAKTAKAPSMKIGCLEAAICPHVGLVRGVVVAMSWRLCVGTNIRPFGKSKKLPSVVG